MKQAFEAAHAQRYGFRVADRALVIESLAVEAVAGSGQASAPARATAPKKSARPSDVVPLHYRGTLRKARVFRRRDLRRGQRISGPAIIHEKTTTSFVEPHWAAIRGEEDSLVLERLAADQAPEAIGTERDPILLEVFNALFMAVAEQMGSALQSTAHSVNIKERLDFSCALFDASGNLIANAPHMPVHLGSMGESVQTIIAARGGAGGRGIQPGDVYMLNAPYNGGTHLPDITVVAPVFSETGAEILFYVAARGHHADIGGITPGSMPPHSRSVEEEGVRFDDFLLVDGGHFREAELRAQLASGPYPARNPDQNVADLKAQIAACTKGIIELHALVRRYGQSVVRAYMAHVQDNAEEAVRRAIGKLKDGSFRYALDDGAAVQVAISIDPVAGSARVDFSGTSAQRPNNFNAPRSVCKAAVLYVFRSLVDDEIPMNAGCLRPIEVIIPAGSMLDPHYPGAVVAGNVETSQYITDALYGALGVLAAAQGTMNNFTFGNERYQYYETICGGSGAGPDFDGTDAVQTHMTNSRLTDPEVLELRFPVLLEEFSIRRGSGGAGKHRGGDGVIRRIRFREPMTASMLAGHRKIPPFGVAGGAPGALGRNWIERADGTQEEFDGTFSAELRPGDVIGIATPGGGGFGTAEVSPAPLAESDAA
jgi:5-oxoprolinase (ATP-hydrolysing)